jgi:pyruvate kinase
VAFGAGLLVPLTMDLGGPKLRIASIGCREKLRLEPGNRFALGSADRQRRSLTATLSHPELPAALAPGDAVWIDDRGRG